MFVYQDAAAALLGLVFPWVVLLVVGMGALALAVTLKWPRGSVARRRVGGGLTLLVLLGAMGLALGLSPSLRKIPAVAITPAALHCSPWGAALDWREIASMETRSQKSGYGWNAVGVWLALSSPAPHAVLPPRPLPGTVLERVGEWLWREDPTAWGGAPDAGSYRYCHLDGLELPVDEIVAAMRTAQAQPRRRRARRAAIIGRAV